MIVLNNPCLMTAPTSPLAYSYVIGSSAYIWSLAPFNSNRLCSATETLTMSPTADWIQVYSDTREIKVLTADMSLGSTSTTFTVTSTQNNASKSTNSLYTFTISLVHPCTVATLNTPIVLDIAVDDGSSES